MKEIPFEEFYQVIRNARFVFSGDESWRIKILDNDDLNEGIFLFIESHGYAYSFNKEDNKTVFVEGSQVILQSRYDGKVRLEIHIPAIF